MNEIRLGSRTLQPRRQLLANGARVSLGKRALDILSVLAEAGGKIVTKDELLEAVWPGVIVEENALQVHVAALRKALGPEAERLKTIRGVGYQLDVDQAPAPAPVEMANLREVASPKLVASPTPELPASHTARARSPNAVLKAALSRVRLHRLAVGLAVVLAVLAGTWALFGSELGIRPKERIPLLVHALTPSGNGNQTEVALAGGVTDELILRLRRLTDLRVATAERDGSAPSAAFNNAYTVKGTIRSSSERVRVSVRLSDANGEIVWSDTLDRRMADLFDMQEEIAAAIAGALSVSFDVGAVSSDYGGTNDPEAYAAYMQYYAHQWNPDQTVATGYLERAVAIDPHFVRGLVGLAQTYAGRASLAATPAEAEAALAKMDEVTARALAADPDLALGINIRGWYYLMRNDIAAADRLIQRATELDPGNDPLLRTALANYAFYTGRATKGAAIRQSLEAIDPIYRNEPWKIFDLTTLGEYRQAIDLFAKLRRADHASLPAFQFHAYTAYLMLGDEGGAAAFARRENLTYGADWQAVRDSGLEAMSDAELKRWAEGFGGAALMNVAATYAGLSGHDRQAAKILRWAMERPGASQMIQIWSPLLTKARQTPEFEQLVTDLGLVRAWRESGDWGDFCRPVSEREIACR